MEDGDGTRGSARHEASKKRQSEGDDDTRETALQIMRTLKERVSPFVFFIRSQPGQLIIGLLIRAGGLSAARPHRLAQPGRADCFAAGS